MQGAGAHQERLILLHGDEVGLRVDDSRPVEAGLLREALSQPRVQAWSEVTVGNREPFDDQDLWLSTALPEFCLLTARQEAIERGLVCPSWRLGTPAVVDNSSFAYRTLRPVDPEKTRYEFGVYAHGPDAGKLADQFAAQIRTWHRDHRPGPGPRFEVYPASTPDARLPGGLVIDKRHTRVTIFWP
jgi:protein-L-isoaspartate(D-aspartate) O-methyltransferase